MSKSRKSHNRENNYGYDEDNQRREKGNFDRRLDMRKDRALRTGNIHDYMALEEDDADI